MLSTTVCELPPPSGNNIPGRVNLSRGRAMRASKLAATPALSVTHVERSENFFRLRCTPLWVGGGCNWLPPECPRHPREQAEKQRARAHPVWRGLAGGGRAAFEGWPRGSGHPPFVKRTAESEANGVDADIRCSRIVHPSPTLSSLSRSRSDRSARPAPVQIVDDEGVPVPETAERRVSGPVTGRMVRVVQRKVGMVVLDLPRIASRPQRHRRG